MLRTIKRTSSLLLLGAIYIVAFGSPAHAANNSIVTLDNSVSDVGKYSSLSLDAAGNPFVSYYDQTSQNLKVARCDNPLCTGTITIGSPDTQGDQGFLGSNTLDAAGIPIISYYDGAPNDDLKVMHCGDPTCTSGNIITTVYTPYIGGYWSTIMLDASGNPVIAFRAHQDVVVMHCNDPACTGGDESVQVPESAGNIGRWMSATLDPAGRPVLAYSLLTNTELHVLRCGDVNCAGGNTISILGPTSPTSQTAVGLDNAGNPIVAFHTAADGALTILHCNDPSCLGGDESIVAADTSGDVGESTSLKLDASGNPVVSYYDYTNADLRIMHCNDPSCAGGDEAITAPDTAGNVGSDTSLELDGSGNPVVSYYDETNHNLKLLHCADPNCFSIGGVGGSTSLTGFARSRSAGHWRLSVAAISVAVLVLTPFLLARIQRTRQPT